MQESRNKTKLGKYFVAFPASCIPLLRTLGGKPLSHACPRSDAKLMGRAFPEQDAHSRQQVGLQGASPGGQADAMGSDRLPLEWGAACSLKSFSMALVPHCGQAAPSPERISTSKSPAHSPQRNSNSGIRHALPG
jgi:hypothetical protein